MIIGHAFLACVLAFFIAEYRGFSSQKTLWFGILAGGFAVLPDIDMLYPFVILTTPPFPPLVNALDVFWHSSTVVHRNITHSLVVSLFTALSFTWIAAGHRRHTNTDTQETAHIAHLQAALAISFLTGLISYVYLTNGIVSAGVLVMFSIGGIALTLFARIHLSFTPCLTAAAMLIGLLSHPFGDFFTGTPPALFYPFKLLNLSDPIAFSPNATLHFLVVFGLELLVVWLVIWRVHTGSFTDIHVTFSWLAAFTIGYASVFWIIAPPTIHSAYYFTLPLATLGALTAIGYTLATDISFESIINATTNGFFVVTIGWVSYALTYLLLG